MPRRTSAAKKLNISTEPKIEPQGDPSAPKPTNEAPKQPQHKPLTNKQAPDANPTTMSQRIANSKQNSGETNDSRIAPTVPQHQQLVNPIGGKPREEQISVMLEHRKLLLQRIRQSKAAAEERLKKPSKRAAVKPMEGKSEEEAYKELTRLAVQAAKKQRQDEQQQQLSQEKRVSVSLRRGSSVGKRMSAAISALTPGSSDANAQAAQPPAAAVPAPAPSAATSSVVPTTMGAAVATKKMKTASQSQSNHHGGAHPGKVPSHEPKKRASYKQNKSAAQSRPNMMPPYAFAAPPPIITEPILPPKPAVIFPEAIALRERNKAVQAKLTALLEKRRTELKPPAVAQKVSIFAKGASMSPSKLPKRRKTQWDYVLEEMRWLSTDFCEERKWKASSGRVLGDAVLTHYADIKKAAEDKKAEAAIKEKIEEIAVNEKKDAVADAVMDDVEEETESESKAPLLGKMYPSPTEEDTAALRASANRMSTMVAELWEGILESGSSWSKPPPAETANTDKDDDKRSEASPVQEVLSQEDAMDKVKGTGVVSPDEKQEQKNGGADPKQLSHVAINEKVDGLMDRIDRRPRQRTRAKQSPGRTKYTLTPVEQKASDFVDFLWKGDTPGGAILGDAYSFSPFDVASFLLKQHLDDGPHLILCPPSRVLRWTSELKATNSGARILLVSDFDAQSKIENLSATDIVVAELSAGIIADRLDVSKFESVILDGNVTLGTSKNISARQIRSGFHSELLSDTWWSALLRSMTSKTQRRLMIANSYMMFDRENEAALLQRLTERERLDFIAGVAAFVFGPSLFQSPKRSALHRVLAWAKNCVKKEQPKGQTRIEQIENHIFQLLKRLTFAPEDQFENVQQSFEEKAIFDTEVVLCKIATKQQSAYDQCCRNLRGALSLGGSLVDAAKGFMQLREVCFHARLRDICSESSVSPAQPNFERVFEIINESAKLKQLVIVLVRDFGYHVEGIDDLESIIPELQPKSRRNSKPAKEGLPKIAILASSPYAQRLTSMLLSALGIDHDNLADSKSFRVPSTPVGGGKVLDNLTESMPWINSQRAMLRYDNSDVDHAGFPFPSVENLVTPRATNIIVGSTMDIAQKENGLSVEASDVLIFLDEDWSGRESQIVKRVLVRCFLHRARHEAERPDFRVYRFICDNCCEEKLLCGFKDNDNTLELIESEEWCTNAVGLVELEESLESKDESFDHFDPDYVFEFPGRNLVSYENEELASFLGTKDPLPSNLESGTELKFLPFEKVSAAIGDAHRETILAFAQKLVEEEINLRAEAKLVGMAVCGGAKALPPFVSLQSIGVAPVRQYVQSFGISGACSNASNGDGFAASFHSNSLYFSSDADTARRDSEEHADGLQPDGSKISAGEVSASILFYGASERIISDQKRKQVDSSNPIGAAMANNLTRSNAFSHAYSQSSVTWSASTRDGTQGCEPLVYFPPVFPSVRQIAAQADVEIADLRSQQKRQKTGDVAAELGSEVPKRSLEGEETGLSAKRPRIEETDIASKNSGQGITAKVPVQKALAPSIVPSLKPEQLPPAGHTPRVVAPLKIGSTLSGPSIPASQGVTPFDSLKLTLADLDEDFGILGTGALPLSLHSVKEASSESVELTEYSTTSASFSNDDLLSSTLCCDFEEAECSRKDQTDMGLGAMILFVPRKAMPGSRSMYVTSPALGSHPQHSQWNSSMPNLPPSAYMPAPGVNGMAGELKSNGAPVTKKGKRKSATPTFSATAAGHPGGLSQNMPGLPPGLNQPKGKDALRHKILGMYCSRPGYGAPGLFESSNFRLAALRVRDRICDRVSKAMGAAGGLSVQKRHLGSSRPWQAQLQAHSPPQWTSIVASSCNADSLSKSLQNESKRADFGPFQVGNLPSVNDVTSIPHPKPGVGLGLPMGVKIPSPRHIRQPQVWVAGEDSRLHLLAVRFGMNWHLVANSLINSHRAPKKSARQCRERWHQLAKTDLSLYRAMEISRRADTSAAVLESAASPSLTTADELYQRVSQDDESMQTDLMEDITESVPERLQSKNGSLEACLAPMAKKEEPSQEQVGQKKKRRSFALFRAAALKRDEIPMPIPGVIAGQKPSLAVTHASHHQALQAAVAALSPGGRTEMWPLQILDLADKQRKASRASSASVRSPHPVQRSSGSYQATQSRHSTVQQQYAPPATQTSTQKAGIPAQPQSSGK